MLELILLCFLLLLLSVSGGLAALRFAERRSEARAVCELAKAQPRDPARFDPAMVSHLPEPARRYFLYTIKPGTRLFTVASLTMTGKFGMGSRDKPDYLTMSARQILSMPTGFLWAMNARRGLMRISGSDSDRWTRFWLMGLLPVARMGGTADHALSAFGRYVGEAVFWTPAAVLPGPNVQWELVDVDTARVTVRHQGLSQSVDVTVAPDGQPMQVRFDRWSNANPERSYRWQPFGGYLSAFREVEGFRLPHHVEAGNFFGTDRYFPFFVADVREIRFHPLIDE
ncbi:hypothetical protein MSNKSG1_01638 [Marinobacter santoriniensis NKSG1]|uniref:Uncharacterized protein n=1 Tax=Marinobacter santoriniensis NKSG1 TaxID=1288826 RepID=M7CVX8_9GAMM|nr:DUF6544 family protein [Marinobacter santoriniensis]EMP57284.1 hypothetical protein MSNKSG1_01638 [Marinobacter santoriniensis NKSG1]